MVYGNDFGKALCLSPNSGVIMRVQLAFKTLFRSPVRTALTIILIGVATFALFSQILEYITTISELNTAAMQYSGTGSVEIEPPNVPPAEQGGARRSKAEQGGARRSKAEQGGARRSKGTVLLLGTEVKQKNRPFAC